MARMMKDSEEKGESCSCGSSSCKKCGGSVKSKYADGGMLASKGPKMRGQGSASAMTHKMIARNAAAKPARDAARAAQDAAKATARKARYAAMKEAHKAKQEATKPQRDAAHKVKMDELRAKRAADPTFSVNRHNAAPTASDVAAETAWRLRRDARKATEADARKDARAKESAAREATKADARKVRNEARTAAGNAERAATKPQRDAARKVRMDAEAARMASMPPKVRAPMAPKPPPGKLSKPAQGTMVRNAATMNKPAPKPKALPKTTPASSPAFQRGGKVKGMSRSKSRAY